MACPPGGQPLTTRDDGVTGGSPGEGFPASVAPARADTSPTQGKQVVAPRGRSCLGADDDLTFEEMQARFKAARARMGLPVVATPVVPRERVMPPAPRYAPPVVVPLLVPVFLPVPVPVPETVPTTMLAFARDDDGAPWTGLEIRRLVLHLSGLSRGVFVSKLRSQSVAWIRQVFSWLARRYAHRHGEPISTTAIGHLVGDRDHTTILHGIRRVEARIAALGPAPEDTPQGWARHLIEGGRG